MTEEKKIYEGYMRVVELLLSAGRLHICRLAVQPRKTKRRNRATKCQPTSITKRRR